MHGGKHCSLAKMACLVEIACSKKCMQHAKIKWLTILPFQGVIEEIVKLNNYISNLIIRF